ncbi:BTB/POZ domain-containing protein 9-like protein [Dinothrombium tinctorium]|uniref:BTB/POZ domain-containing protein 9-like protein n=1 Tax=Dinothrombium tinctorium TaxID=1965070 RepID=A0A3S3PIY4_9ACAR|nr:BTB/POZ domain-containing protein 9-like protein [Dinothrombium tinctorium]
MSGDIICAESPSEIMSKLYLNEELCDIRFVVEGETIAANKAILAASCEYFRIQLFGETNESRKKEIVLTGTPKDAFKPIVKFIYTGRIEIRKMDTDHLISLLSLSHEYQFRRLLHWLEAKFEQERIIFDNINKVFKISSLYEIDSLLEKCWRFIESNAKEIVEDKTIFTSFSFKLVDQIVCRETFIADEIDIFKALMEWKKSYPECDITSVLANIRWDQISLENFHQYVRPFGVFTDTQYIDASVIKKGKRGNNSPETESSIYNNFYPIGNSNIFFSNERDRDRCHSHPVKLYLDCECSSVDPEPSDHMESCQIFRTVMHDLIYPYFCKEISFKTLQRDKKASFSVSISPENDVTQMIEIYKRQVITRSLGEFHHNISFPKQRIQ